MLRKFDALHGRDEDTVKCHACADLELERLGGGGVGLGCDGAAGDEVVPGWPGGGV